MAIVDNKVAIVPNISIASTLLLLLLEVSTDCVASIVILVLIFVLVFGASWAFGIVDVGVADVGVISKDTTITSALIMVRFLCWYWYCSEAKITNNIKVIICITKAILMLIIENFVGEVGCLSLYYYCI